MGKPIFTVGATVCTLVAEPVAYAAAIALAIFQSALLIGRGNLRERPDVKVYTVYRYDFNRHARESIGQLVERRRRERGNNYRDLLKQARQLYSTPSLKSLVFLSPD